MKDLNQLRKEWRDRSWELTYDLNQVNPNRDLPFTKRIERDNCIFELFYDPQDTVHPWVLQMDYERRNGKYQGIQLQATSLEELTKQMPESMKYIVEEQNSEPVVLDSVFGNRLDESYRLSNHGQEAKTIIHKGVFEGTNFPYAFLETPGPSPELFVVGYFSSVNNLDQHLNQGVGKERLEVHFKETADEVLNFYIDQAQTLANGLAHTDWTPDCQTDIDFDLGVAFWSDQKGDWALRHVTDDQWAISHNGQSATVALDQLKATMQNMAPATKIDVQDLDQFQGLNQ